MTRAEAIKIMEQRECCRECVVSDFTCKDCDTAFEMAIKALEQQTCEDAVSREAVLDLFAKNCDTVRPYSTAWEEVKALPSVKPMEKVESCKDAVSRQAAIDAVNDVIADYVPNIFGRYEALPLEMASAIHRLPPVTPQYTDVEIQKMQDLEQAEIQKAYELGNAEEPKTGHWIEHEPFDADRHNCNVCIECSNCHTWFEHDCYAKTDYCPKCGAKMVEPQERSEE